MNARDTGRLVTVLKRSVKDRDYWWRRQTLNVLLAQLDQSGLAPDDLLGRKGADAIAAIINLLTVNEIFRRIDANDGQTPTPQSLAWNSILSECLPQPRV